MLHSVIELSQVRLQTSSFQCFAPLFAGGHFVPVWAAPEHRHRADRDGSLRSDKDGFRCRGLCATVFAEPISSRHGQLSSSRPNGGGIRHTPWIAAGITDTIRRPGRFRWGSVRIPCGAQGRGRRKRSTSARPAREGRPEARESHLRSGGLRGSECRRMCVATFRELG